MKTQSHFYSYILIIICYNIYILILYYKNIDDILRTSLKAMLHEGTGRIDVKPVGLSPSESPGTIGLRVLEGFFADFVFCGLKVQFTVWPKKHIAATLWQTNIAMEYPHV